MKKKELLERLLKVNMCGHYSGCPRLLRKDSISSLLAQKGIVATEPTKSLLAQMAENYLDLIVTVAADRNMELNTENISKIVSSIVS